MADSQLLYALISTLRWLLDRWIVRSGWDTDLAICFLYNTHWSAFCHCIALCSMSGQAAFGTVLLIVCLVNADSAVFPWQQSLGLISPVKAGGQQGKIPTPTASTPAALHDSFRPISPQALFSYPGRNTQPQMRVQDQGHAGNHLPESSMGPQQQQRQQQHQQHQQQPSSQHVGFGSQQGNQPSLSWSSGLGLGMPLALGSPHPGMDRVGTTGSAFSAWAPLPIHSVPSMQGSGSRLGAASHMSGTTGAASRASATGPGAVSGLPSLGSVPTAGAYQSALPLGSHATAVSAATLPYSFPGQMPAAVSVSSSAAPDPQFSPAGIRNLPFSTLLPQMPFLPPSPYLTSQWPLMHGLTPSQPPYLPQLSYSAPPYPLGFAHLPPHLPHQLPSNPLSPVSMPAPILPNPNQNPGLLPYHLPPYLPNPMQILVSSQAPLPGPDLNLLTPLAANQALQVKLEPGSAAHTPGPLPPEQRHAQLHSQVLAKGPRQQEPMAAQQRETQTPTRSEGLSQSASTARVPPVTTTAAKGKSS